MSETEEYEILQNIGRGYQGKVQKVKKIVSGEIYALKIFEVISDAEREIEILRTLSFPGCHPIVLCYKGAIKLEKTIGLLTEFVEGYNLSEIARYKGDIKDDDLIRISRYIFDGLSYIHLNGIVHNDISPVNFIFSDNGLKIIDFGLACFYQEDVKYKCEPEKTTNNLFELETDEIKYNPNLYPKIDVIMAGIMLWRFKNTTLGFGKSHHFIEMTSEYEKFILGISSTNKRSSYYILNAPTILNKLQSMVDHYLVNTKSSKLEMILRMSTIVNPYSRPNAAEMVLQIDSFSNL